MAFSEDKKNTKALGVGLALVVLVIVLTFLRPLLKRSDGTLKNNSPKTVQTDEMEKKKISSSGLMEKIKNHESFFIIDVREPEFFQAAHILDSQNFPLSGMNSSVSQFERNGNYIFVDDTTSPSILELIRNIFPENDIRKAFYLEGGFSDWKNQGYPTISDGDPYSINDQSKVTYISSDELKTALENKENIQIIDLRKDIPFADGHIRDSMNIFLGDLENKRNEIPSGKKIILVDNDGLWAFKGAVKLFDMGIFNVFSLSDGLDAWKEKGYEIVK